MVNKVLVLHGYAQNAQIFSKRLGALRKACGKDVDFVFADAPLILQPADLAGFSASALGASEAAVNAQDPDPAELPRGWWTSNPERTVYTGVSESLAALGEVLSKGTFDGIFGFSQGAAMAALTAAVLEKPNLYPPFIRNEAPIHPPFKFCVAVAGFKPNDDEWTKFFSEGYATPTLHVLGTTDVIIPPKRAQTLVDASTNRRVVTHDGGHFVPSKAVWRNFLRDYLKDPSADVAPPPMSDGASSLASSLNGTPVSSQPASGTVTPSNL